MKKKIHLICAARPNFMKVAPLYHQIKKEGKFQPFLVHTGQHYDYKMSQTFFDDLGLGSPEFYLNIGSGSHAEQTGKVMIAYEKLCQEESPDLVVVVGDVNSTLAAAISAKKLHKTVAHLEAGLRSFDRSMPEEINRIATDSISDYFWTPSSDADEQLKKEGMSERQIRMVGNIMIDSFCLMKEKIYAAKTAEKLQLKKKEYGVLTLHRPANVDNQELLLAILDKVNKIGVPFLFPVHPRTKKALEGSEGKFQNLKLVEPLGYIEFMGGVIDAKIVVTDSGGLQEETTYLGIPCFTMRPNTERPITVSQGSNQLVTMENLLEKTKNPKKGSVPHFWDGQTAQRICAHLNEIL